MSRNTSIKEGGKARPFGPVKALMVQGDGGKYYPWYPEADRALDSLSVDKNGVYRASDRGVYGWDRVSVNVTQGDRVTGKDPQTGQEVTVIADPETGELVETVVPVEIRVIELPTNPYGTYVDGQTITKDGMVVKAYDANGDEMQVVPIGEVTINPTTAVFDPDKDPNIYSDGDGVNAVKQNTGKYARQVGGWGNYYIGDRIGEAIAGQYAGSTIYSGENAYSGGNHDIYITIYDGYLYTKRADNVSVRISVINVFSDDSRGPYIIAGFVDASDYWRKQGPISGLSDYKLDIPVSTKTPLNSGELTPMAGSPQTITVSWPRPGDGAVLETTFDIRVGPHGGTGDD